MPFSLHILLLPTLRPLQPLPLLLTGTLALLLTAILFQSISQLLLSVAGAPVLLFALPLRVLRLLLLQLQLLAFEVVALAL
jgi:hypothetical protein